MSEAHEAPIKNPKQLIALVIASFALPVIIIALLVSYVDNATRTGAGTDGLSHEQVSRRIAPVARVEIRDASTLGEGQRASDTSAAATQSAAAASSSSAQAAAAAIAAISSAPPSGSAATSASADATQAGKALYQQVCQACHAAGIAGAPKLGDKAAWAPRLKESMDTVYHYALHGKGAMPPKGGSNASDADVKAAVDYMVGAAK
ncbi:MULTISPECIES: cytochrome c5 family protein [Burkholderiaceae]|uniref:c-type cytochrome n=1 Tax=Burkholderiaceae TaxID=119060 RepID=UPI000968EC01|nr:MULTISPECIES: c-type cytochrome [Burkholderiaceae]MCG1017348.1 c-type cytochrome [Mycetohabitans sp. B4]SIT71249.1 Cytochrome c5 [Burkholderia sp. b13]